MPLQTLKTPDFTEMRSAVSRMEGANKRNKRRYPTVSLHSVHFVRKLKHNLYRLRNEYAYFWFTAASDLWTGIVYYSNYATS